MVDRSTIIADLATLGRSLNADNEQVEGVIQRAYSENNWLTPENYRKAIHYWSSVLTEADLEQFTAPYSYAEVPLKVGIIMAGNLPMVGFHDLVCVLLSGHKAVVKPSSDDKVMMEYLIKSLIGIDPSLADRIEIVERVSDIDAVIATGSNNTYRYFEYYFSKVPNLLRKNRKSMAVLSGNESDEQLKALADDVFEYFGLGCRNVSLMALPRTMRIERILDHLMHYGELINHHKYANNYTYHKAMLLMNSDLHLDGGFVLAREQKELNTPLASIHYFFYDDISEVDEFIQANEQDIQCVVGPYEHPAAVNFGEAQKPKLQDFADQVDTMDFLQRLK